MTAEKLKELLESGAITEAEYNELANKPEQAEKVENSEADMEKRIEKLVQSAVDRTAQKWSENSAYNLNLIKTGAISVLVKLPAIIVSILKHYKDYKQLQNDLGIPLLKKK